MVLFDGALGVLLVALWLFCLVDVITTPDSQVRNLPKLVWLLLVLILPDVGSLAWLIAGRNWNKQPTPRPTARPANRPLSPDDDEEFLAGLRARAEEQRRRAREASQGDEEPKG